MATIYDDKKVFGLQIQRISDGGFLVLDGYRPDTFTGPRFASTSIEEALKYCKKKLELEHE